SKVERWQQWNGQRAIDRPLRGLLQMVGLAMRGLVLVPVGLIASLPAPRGASPRKRTATVASLAALFLLWPSPADSAPQVPAFDESYPLPVITGSAKPIELLAAHSVENVFVDVPVTKIVSAATFDLRAKASRDLQDAVLELSLNGTRVAAPRLPAGEAIETSISLPADLFTSNNTLSLRIRGACPGCDPRAAWATIGPASTLRIRGSRLPLANDVALLPIPFIDLIGARVATIPVVFLETPDESTLQAAATIASWFGVFADVRGVRFPVTLGQLPPGNAVVFVTRRSPAERTLNLPAGTGAFAAIRENPVDPYGKLLVLAGARSTDLMAAAQ